MKNNKHIGSDFDAFLEKEGILEESEAAAIKKLTSYQLQKEEVKNRITQTDMAKRLGNEQKQP